MFERMSVLIRRGDWGWSTVALATALVLAGGINVTPAWAQGKQETVNRARDGSTRGGEVGRSNAQPRSTPRAPATSIRQAQRGQSRVQPDGRIGQGQPQVINRDGIGRDGRVIDHNGRDLGRDQHVIDRDSRVVDRDSRVIDRDSRVIDRDSRVIDRDHRGGDFDQRRYGRDVRVIDRDVRVVGRDPRIAVRRPVRYGSVFRRPVATEYKRTFFGGREYFCDNDFNFFLSINIGGDTCFEACRPPIGVQIGFLPELYETLIIDGATYFYYDDVYYTQQFIGGQPTFVVVEPPIGAVITTLPIGHQAVVVGGARFYQHGNCYYRPFHRGDALSYVRVNLGF